MIEENVKILKYLKTDFLIYAIYLISNITYIAYSYVKTVHSYDATNIVGRFLTIASVLFSVALLMFYKRNYTIFLSITGKYAIFFCYVTFLLYLKCEQVDHSFLVGTFCVFCLAVANPNINVIDTLIKISISAYIIIEIVSLLLLATCGEGLEYHSHMFYAPRLQGIMSHPVMLSAIVVLLLIWYISKDTSRLNYLIIILNSIVLYFTHGYTALVIYVVILIEMVLHKWVKKTFEKYAALVFISFTVISYFLLVNWGGVNVLTGRVVACHVGLERFKKEKISGLLFGGTIENYVDIASEGLYYRVLCWFGIICFLMFMIFIVDFGFKSWKLYLRNKKEGMYFRYFVFFLLWCVTMNNLYMMTYKIADMTFFLMLICKKIDLVVTDG